MLGPAPALLRREGVELKGQGIDEIACISVNDPFVMAAWGKRDGSSDITMLADGNGAFADAVGLTMDGSKFGLGQRSQRYSMIVNDGVVEQLNVEGPGEYRASSAETMLEQLQPPERRSPVAVPALLAARHRTPGNGGHAQSFATRR